MSLNYGLKISKPGYTVSSATVFNVSIWSKFPVWKIKAQGTITCDFADGESTKQIEVNHGLAYWPETWIFWEDTDGKVHHINTGNAESDDFCRVRIYKLDPYCTLQFTRDSSVGADSMYAYYYFFYDQLYDD